MSRFARIAVSLLAVIVLTTATADATTPAPYAASVQDLESRTRSILQSVVTTEPVPDDDFRQALQTPKTTFHVGTPPRTNSRIIQDLTEAFAAYIGLHAIDCMTQSAAAPPEALAANPIADAVWKRLNQMTGGRVSANVGFSTQQRIAKQRLVPQRTIDAKVTVGLFGPQFSHARGADRCR